MTQAAPGVPSLDRQRLAEALALAEGSVGLSEPNPRVGCIIGMPDGRVLGSGHTQAAGSAHAEIMALRDAASRGHDVRGATAWVTLEPCAHHGRTPPCCDALVAAGIRRVVSAIGDPNPQVNGQGHARLREAGIEVQFGEPELADAARELNIGFFSRMQRGRPWVRAKAAASLDGHTALPDGRSQWITGEAARRDGHAWRRRAGVVLSGIGTVLADDPRLDVRLVSTARQPLRAIIDNRLQLPPTARLLAVPGLLVYTTQPLDHPAAQRLRDAGAQPVCGPAGPAGIDLGWVIGDLGQRGVNEVHVEAGARLNGALAQAGWVDEWLLYLAPVWLGQGLPVAALPVAANLPEAPRLQWLSVDKIGEDLRLRLRLPASAPAAWGASP